MKKSLAAVLLIAFILVSATLQVASAATEIIELPPLQTVNRTVDLQINDRLTVTLTANNNSYVSLSARVLDPMLRPAATWLNYQNNSFTYIASELAGTYTVGIVYENDTSGSSNSNIDVTLSYEVEHLSATATPQPTQTNTGNAQDWTTTIIVAAVVAALVIVTALVLIRRRKS